MDDLIVNVKKVNKAFLSADGQELSVLKDVDLQLKENEIVALLGKSGSGKSTLLRIIAGLVYPTTGEVLYRNQPVEGPIKELSMVFQSFALMPWLTVLQNVELGLEAQGVPRDERRKRALKAIDTIGLDGFESAYPKELSGGMRQRVGFARALVVNPDLLLMDEPFSALDVLTADNLRSDLLELWVEKKTNTKGILIVTHNIEEAVIIADRVIVLSSNPGTIYAELKIDLPQPRDEDSLAFRKYVDQIYQIMMERAGETRQIAARMHKRDLGLGYPLPDTNVSELTGLLESLVEYEGEKIDLPKLAEEWHLDIDDLFPMLETLELFGLTKISHGNVELTKDGKQFAEADILERKQMFAKYLKDHVPLIQHICHILHDRRGHRASEDRFLTKLEDYFTEKEAERVLETAIGWGRYAELFAYDYNTGVLSLEDPE
ncbi:MAG: nitrate/sulfonate/bicarbonate ABC transporter ATP-binding protein [Gammaproteobacteria bacterium]|nr:nitrate/sulfonate/bicarbonate ABC transporter ATP-binding protein [Gammaproteobacteria bacterium]